MASWKEVKNFIRTSYKLETDKGDFFSMIFEFDDGRSQVVFVQRVKTQAGDWIQISSPVGEIEADDLDDALETLSDVICGGLVKIGDTHFVRHCMPIADLSKEEFDDPLRIIVGAADGLEARFVGGDEN